MKAQIRFFGIALAMVLSAGLLPGNATTFNFSADQGATLADAQAADTRGDYSSEMHILFHLMKHGNAAATNDLGVMFQFGKGTVKSDAMAFDLYKKASSEGSMSAQANIGWMYYNGHGVKKDVKRGVRHFRIAAKAGNPEAQFNLAKAYASGVGAVHNYILAYMFANLAAASGFKRAVNLREELAKVMPRAAIEIAQKGSVAFVEAYPK